jgi:glycosyltransferase involved in cell wall biosynthesis
MADEVKPVIWLLSAYHADSHAAWANRLMERFDGFEWRLFTLPGRHFRWRIRGNPLSWLESLPRETPQLLLATSMVDLATLKGLQPRLADVPSVYYFHENQFAYPRSDRQHSSVDPQMVQLYGALAAGRIAFNSAYNRDSFLRGVEELLHRLPDAVPKGLARQLENKAVVCPVPLSPPRSGGDRDPGLILWNHRWEYDKDPDLFASAMLELARGGCEFRLALLGPRPTPAPNALVRLRRELPERILVDGRVDAQDYGRWLNRAGIVVSTARHEFQGLAVMEAAAAGALPLVPDALCYPEQYPAQYRYPAAELTALVRRLAEWLGGKRPAGVDVSEWYAETIWERWRTLLTPR